jgi:energy-coupling factor transporter ATP-binding protein EcfA2
LESHPVSVVFEEVSFTYPGATQPALQSLTAKIDPGVVTLVTGPLGSGSSTLLLAAAGIVPALTGGRLTGRISTLQRDPTDPAERRALAGQVGLLLPTPWTQLSGMAETVADEIAFGPANHGWKRDRISSAVEQAMERTGVTHLASRDPTTLSGGELQRVLLAALVAMDPAVYLFDEPALELDPVSAEALYHLLPELARVSVVIVATTDVDRAVEIADRVILLDQGRCLSHGRPAAALGAQAAVDLRASTTVAQITSAAGWTPPYPITVAEAARRGAR